MFKSYSVDRGVIVQDNRGAAFYPAERSVAVREAPRRIWDDEPSRPRVRRAAQQHQPADNNPLEYFVNDYERRIGNAVRFGKRAVTSAGVFLYVGSLDRPLRNGETAEREHMLTGKAIEVESIKPSYFEVNKDAGIVLRSLPENGREFDQYAGLAFTKGMTDLKTQRSMLIVGDYTHHGQAAQGFFKVGERPYSLNDPVGFGNVILWNNIGDEGTHGFLGVDYMHNCERQVGGARSLTEIHTLAEILIEQGFSPERPVILLRTPNLRETSLGKYLRTKRSITTLKDYAGLSKDVTKDNGLAEFLLGIQGGIVDYLLGQETQADLEARRAPQRQNGVD